MSLGALEIMKAIRDIYKKGRTLSPQVPSEVVPRPRLNVQPSMQRETKTWDGHTSVHHSLDVQDARPQEELSMGFSRLVCHFPALDARSDL